LRRSLLRGSGQGAGWSDGAGGIHFADEAISYVRLRVPLSLAGSRAAR
jgi:hypothetical protein